MAEEKKNVTVFGKVRLSVKQIEDIGIARKKGDSPALIAQKMQLKVVQVRNVITALTKRGVKFPVIARATQSQYIEIAKKLM